MSIILSLLLMLFCWRRRRWSLLCRTGRICRPLARLIRHRYRKM